METELNVTEGTSCTEKKNMNLFVVTLFKERREGVLEEKAKP